MLARLLSVPSRSRRRLASRWNALRASNTGVAAVEFALVLPIMVTLLLGMSEITHAVNVDRKLTLLSRSLADLSSREKEIDAAALLAIFSAASVIMQPFDASKVEMTVSSIEVTWVSANNYTHKVIWSCPRGAAASEMTNSTPYVIPEGFKNATSSKKSYHMQIGVKLPYTPMFGKAITGTINLAESTPWPIRSDGNVTLKNGICPAKV